MGFDHADDHVCPVTPSGLCGVQHLVSFSDPGRGAEEDLQPAAALLLCRSQQCLG
jgi:hypothetical protein